MRISPEKISINGKVYTVTNVYTAYDLAYIQTESGQEFYLARNKEHAADEAFNYYEGMIELFAQYGNHSNMDVFDKHAYDLEGKFGAYEIEKHPEYLWAMSDGKAKDRIKVGRLLEHLPYKPGVAYLAESGKDGHWFGQYWHSRMI